jgi:hypothetical protein
MYIPNVHTDKLLQTETDKWQTRPLVREGAPQGGGEPFPVETFRWEMSGWLDTKTYWLTDRQS